MDRNEYKLLVGQKYVPEDYWNERSIPNTSRTELISTIHRDFIKKHIRDRNQIFELGPGDGRLFQLYGGKTLSTLDLTNKHSEFLVDKAVHYNIQLNQFYYANVLDSFPFSDKKFEIAVASQVLIHIPFEAIKHAICELLRISESVLIISSKVPSWPKTQAEVKVHSHCFTHDYVEMFKGLNSKVIEIEENEKTLMIY